MTVLPAGSNPVGQPRIVEVHFALADEGGVIRHGQRLADLILSGANENPFSCVGRREAASSSAVVVTTICSAMKRS